MTRWLNRMGGLPIKWKLTIGTSAFIFVLFFSYNLFQYFLINEQTLSYEKENINDQLNEINAYFQGNQDALFKTNLKNSKLYLTRINEKNQLIRIFNQNNKMVLETSNRFSAKWLSSGLKNKMGYELIRNAEDRILILRTPITTKRFTGTIEIARNLEMFDHFINNILLAMVISGIGALLISILGGMLISERMLLNVKAITGTMKKIKTKGLNERVPVNQTNDELDQLGKLFNELMDDLEESFQQQKKFVEDASHELRTPLAIIKGHLTMLNRWGKNDPLVLNKSLDSSLKEVDRLIRLVQELLELSKSEKESQFYEVESIQIATVIDRVIKNFEILHLDFTFSKKVDENLFITIAPRHLEQILISLFDNSIKYSNDEKELKVVCTQENKMVSIKVSDKGIGIPKEDIPYVLNRFYRVDKARSRKKGGHGLGLAIVKNLVERYKGMIEIQSSEKGGTTVVLSFPLYA